MSSDFDSRFEEEYNQILKSFLPIADNEDEDSPAEHSDDEKGETECSIIVDDIVDHIVNLELARQRKQQSTVITVDAVDDSEARVIDELYGQNSIPCCSVQCNKIINKDVAVAHRSDFMEMSKDEQDLFILSKIQSLRRAPECTTEYYQRTTRTHNRKSTDKTLERCAMTYQFLSLEVCKKFFFFVTPVGKKRYFNLLKHYSENGIAPRRHKLAGMSPYRDQLISVDETIAAVTFISNYANKNAIPLPGRMPNCKNFAVIKLPSSDCKMSVYRQYCDAIRSTVEVGAPEPHIMKKSSFLGIWNKYLPHITVMKPHTDLCDICRLNIRKIQRANGATEYDSALQKAKDHLDVVKVERSYYNEWREKAHATTEMKYHTVEGSFQVLSFDFAQQIQYPSHPQQVGPAYFKTGRKCGIFGIHDERTRVQHNYLIDEADTVSKDNCRGQNKNNTVLQYLLWRVLTKKNRLIEYNFMIPGHTKFSPDRSFGILKRKFNLYDVDTLEDMVDCVYASSPNHFNIPKPTMNVRTGERYVPWLDWKTYLQSFFKKFPGLTSYQSYQHFLFEENGTMSVRLKADSESEPVSLQIATLDSLEAVVIEEMLPDGLSPERLWYLYDSVRELCFDESKKDLVCPLPSVPRPKKKISVEICVEPSTSAEPAKGKRGRPHKESLSAEPEPSKPARGRTRKRNLDTGENDTRTPKQKAQKMSAQKSKKPESYETIVLLELPDE